MALLSNTARDHNIYNININLNKTLTIVSVLLRLTL